MWGEREHMEKKSVRAQAEVGQREEPSDLLYFP
jgi:hypothetical protein